MEVNDQVMNGGEEVKISENNLAVDNNNEPEPVNESNDMENDLDSDDLLQEDETNKFLSLMSKAERKNQRKLRNIQKQSANSSHTWRDAMLSDPEDDTEDTDDEDDPDETRKFLSMMQAKKKNMVKIRWVNGKVEVTPISEDDNSQTSGDSSSFPDTLTVTRMAPGETQASSSRKTLPDSVTITRVPGGICHGIILNNHKERLTINHTLIKKWYQLIITLICSLKHFLPVVWLAVLLNRRWQKKSRTFIPQLTIDYNSNWGVVDLKSSCKM